MDECYDKIRLSLSDESGELRFESFEIVDMPDCQELAGQLREYLVGRPLAQADPHRVRSMSCPSGGACMLVVARIIEEYQRLFSAAGERR